MQSLKNLNTKYQLEREKQQISEKKLFITYYPAFQNSRSIIEELTPKKEHKKVFPNVRVVGFQNGKSLKDYLVKPKYLDLRRVGDVNHVRKNLLGL